MSDWDEIRRLAADLQRAQLSGAAQKLSERNCIEIVSRLIEAGLVEVVHTADGKEYLTPQQLQREIRDELAVSRGRVSLVDLASTLNVDFSHVEAQGQTVARQDGHRTHLVLGQLVDSDYLDSLCEQVNEGLQLNGTISISTLTKEYDLPSEFLQEEVGKRLGGIIEGFRDSQDPRIILTTSYVQRNRAKIRGALSAVTVPTPVLDIVNRFSIQEHLFFSLAEELIQTGRLRGSLTGGRRAAKATFVPAVYSKAQVKWVDDFMAQNGYVEFESVRRVGISDPVNFLKKRFSEKDVHFLSGCCLGAEALDMAESAVEEALSGSVGSWVDVGPLLPSALSQEDAKQVLQTILSRRPALSAMLLADTVAVSQSLVHKVQQTLEDLIPEKAKGDLDSGKYEALLSGGAGGASINVEEERVDRKEERRKKAATGKGGGGTQGRETKTKSTKRGKGNKRRGDDNWGDDSDQEVHQQQHQQQGKGGSRQKKGAVSTTAKVEFMSFADLKEKIAAVTQLEDCPEEVFGELAGQIYPVLTQRYRETLFELHRSTTAASLHDRSKAHAELQEKCNVAISHIRLFEKGLAHFEGQERRGLERHLMKTQCTELANSLFRFHAQEDQAKKGASSGMGSEERVQVIRKVGKEEGEALLAVHKAIAAEEVATFIEVFEENAQSACDVFVRKSDKKKDRQLAFGHRQSLLEKLEACQEPALCLHLALLVMFQTTFNSMLHASGKFVPQILAKVAPLVEDAEADFLHTLQDLVVGQAAGDESDQNAEEELQGLLPRLKELAGRKKKGSKNEDH